MPLPLAFATTVRGTLDLANESNDFAEFSGTAADCELRLVRPAVPLDSARVIPSCLAEFGWVELLNLRIRHE
jgi:hypothetical protein